MTSVDLEVIECRRARACESRMEFCDILKRSLAGEAGKNTTFAILKNSGATEADPVASICSDTRVGLAEWTRQWGDLWGGASIGWSAAKCDDMRNLMQTRAKAQGCTQCGARPGQCGLWPGGVEELNTLALGCGRVWGSA